MRWRGRRRLLLAVLGEDAKPTTSDDGRLRPLQERSPTALSFPPLQARHTDRSIVATS